MKKPTVSFVSLGCPKNLVDSERMLGLLAEAGCPIVGDEGKADVLVINTCGFLSASRDEALGILREAAQDKKKRRIGRIVVAGCLVQRDGQGLLEEVPEIDALVGVHNRADVVRAVLGETPTRQNAKTLKQGGKSKKVETSKSQKAGSVTSGSTKRLPHGRGSDQAGRSIFLGEYHAASWIDANKSDQSRLRLTPSHYAYLRVSEGCNQKCTFCTIPSIRGPMHCKTIPEILAEARELVEDGAVELNLIGQDTTSFGQDIGYKAGLSGLLRELNGVDGAEWIRLMYVYPSDFTDEMIDAIAQNEKIAKYIDIPLQHINDRVLKAMHRRVTRKQTETLLEKLRKRIPGVAIRTTMIAGFPGETDAEFAELRQFVRDFRFDALGCFPYSSEPGTPAHRMNNPVPAKVIAARVEQLMQDQQQVAFAAAEAQRGKLFTVMIDGFGKRGTYPARHQGQAPDVDSHTLVEGGEYDPGELVQVRCTGHDGYDLIARPITNSLPILQ